MTRFVCVSLLILSQALSPAAAPAGPSAASSIFAEIYHFALLNRSVRFDSETAIRSTWSSEYTSVFVGMVTRTDNRYLVCINDAEKRTDIAIRGTTNLRNLVYDVRFLREYDPELDIRVHKGFSLMSEQLVLSIGPLLRKDYAIRLSGQSLGAAEALLTAMRLSREGYRIDSIITFGQPKVTDAQGAQRYGFLPLIRVVNENDVIPLLPPINLVYREDPYVHFGGEINLLDGVYYCREKNGVTDRPLPKRMFTDLSRDDIDTLMEEHSIRTYVDSIRAKLDGAIEVPAAERERYIPQRFQFPLP